MRKSALIITALAWMGSGTAAAEEISLHQFNQGEPARASDINGNFAALKAKIEEQGKALAALQKEVQTLSGKNAEGVQVQPPKISPGKISEQSDGFIFTMLGCRKGNNDVTCEITITSLEKDQSISIYGYYNIYPNLCTKLFDDLGNQYFTSNISLGNESRHTNMLSRSLIADIATKASFKFSNITKKASYIAALEINFVIGSSNKSIRMRNIPIE